MAMLSASQSILKVDAGDAPPAIKDLTRAVIEMQGAYEKAARCAIFGMKALGDVAPAELPQATVAEKKITAFGRAKRSNSKKR
ncbi:MAG: hypothetical protein NVSMB64_00240 [Candidatus Velthaea sp.]